MSAPSGGRAPLLHPPHSLCNSMNTKKFRIGGVGVVAKVVNFPEVRLCPGSVTANCGYYEYLIFNFMKIATPPHPLE